MNDTEDTPATGPGQNQAPAYFNKQQIANRYGVSVRTIESLMAENKIPFLRLTRKLVRFPVLEVDDYFSRNLRVNAVGEDGGAR